MPSSVSSPDDRIQNLDSAIAVFLSGGRRPIPGLRVAAVLAAVGSVAGTTHAQDVFNGGGADGSIFEANDNWDGGTYPGDDFGADTIDFSGGSTINVSNLIFGVGGMTNSSNGDIVLGGTGSWTFDAGGATVTPGTGSFTFDLDVTALGDVTFELADGSVVFNGAFNTSGGTILAKNGIVDFNGEVNSSDGTTWEGTGGGGFNFNGVFDATGNQTFNLADGSATFNDEFNAIGGGTILANAGFVDFNGVVNSSDGTTWEGTGGGGFNFNDAFNATGNQTFQGTDLNDIFTFNGDATFMGVGGNATATFNDATVSFASTLIINEDSDPDANSAYAFLLNDAKVTIADMEVNVETFTFNLGGSSTVDVNGVVAFTQEDATLQVRGSGTLEMSGDVSLANAFTLLVTDSATVNWNAITTMGGEAPVWTINTSGDGDATVAITGNQTLVGGDDAVIRIVTDEANDSVSIGNKALVGYTGTIQVADGSAMTFAGGGAGGAEDGSTGVSLELGTTSEVMLETIDPVGTATAPNTFLFENLNNSTVATDEITAVDSGSIVLDAAFDGTVVIRNGIFAGSFEDAAGVDKGDLSVWWAKGETRYNGSSTIDGTYEIKNEGVHRIGTLDFDLDGGGDPDTIRASVVADAGFFVTQATAYLENADVDSGDGLTLVSGNTSAATLVIENTSTLSAAGDLSMNAGSILQITGESEAAVGDVGGINLEIGGLSTIDGSIEISAESDRTVDPADPLAWIANASFDGAATIGTTGSLTLSNSAYAVFGDTLASSGSITLQDTAYLDVAGTYTQSGGTSVFEAGTTFTAADLVLEDGAVLELNDSNLNDDVLAIIQVDNGIDVQSGATLFGSGEISMAAGNLEYAGIVMAGAMNESEGLLHITDGDLISQAGGELHFGLNGELALAISDDIGQSSIIRVDGLVDFSESGSLVVDVQSDSYIPTNLTFTLLEAGEFVNDDNVDLQAGTPSVTRTWNWGIDALGMLGNRIYAQSDADYTNTLTGSQYQIGALLNGFIPQANVDPTGSYGVLLGQLDQIQTAAEYQTAITGLEPTAQISAIQVSALGQYHEVLRREIRQRFTEAERRTPTPFRIGEPMQLMSADDAVVSRSIRRAASPETSAQGFGTFWSRDLRTATEGDVVGLDGNEFGGLGAFAWDLSDSVVAGIDLGYSAFMGDLDRGYGNTRIGTLRGGGFATWSNGEGLFMDGAISAAWNHYDFTRLVPGTDLSAQSNADGWQIDASVGLGYRIELQEGFAFTPMGSFLYSYINTGQIDETTDSVAALSIDPGDLSVFIGRVGAGLSWSALPGLVIDGEAGWQGNFTDNGDYSVALSELGATVPVEVVNQTINTAYYGAGVSWTPTRNVTVNLNWEGRSGDGLHSNMLFGGVSISF